jgi:hypothetical protein
MKAHDGGNKAKVYWSSWMYGASKQTPQELAALARSWLQPPQLNISAGDVSYEGYDFTQRAYILNCSNGKPDKLEIELMAGDESPIVNICMIINGWEADNITVQLNETVLQEKKEYKIGKRRELTKEYLILWIEHESLSTSRILLSR